jgi:predicted nucleic acid-binding protein
LKYLVDTDWIIDHLNGRENVTLKLKEFAREGIATSMVSIAGLYEGVYGSKDYEKSVKALEKFLEGVSIVNLDMEVCKIFGKERSKLRKIGQIIGDFYLLIASICLRHKLILLTNNKDHFERVDGLHIFTLDR